MSRRTKYDIPGVLQAEGPLLTNELAGRVSGRHAISVGAAKKAVSRSLLTRKIQRIDSITFGRKEHLYYLKSMSEELLRSRAIAILERRRPIIARFIQALRNQEVMTHRDGLKITGLPTREAHGKPSYEAVMRSLVSLGFAHLDEVEIGERKLKFLVLNKTPPIDREIVTKVAKEMIKEEGEFREFLEREKRAKNVKELEFHTQKGSRIFDATGLAVSQSRILIVYDFVPLREVQEYDIAGLLDRIYVVFRKKFKQTVITYCLSKYGFAKSAQERAMTGRFKHIKLVRFEKKNHQIFSNEIYGIASANKGEYFENQVRYILRKVGLTEVQRGLILYRKGNKLTESPTATTFTDIDIAARNKQGDTVVLAQLKDWNRQVPQEEAEDWITNKLNPVIDHLRTDLKIGRNIDAWYVVSDKQGLNHKFLATKAKCAFFLFDKDDFLDFLANLNRGAVNEMRMILSK